MRSYVVITFNDACTDNNIFYKNLCLSFQTAFVTITLFFEVIIASTSECNSSMQFLGTGSPWRW